MDQAEILNYSRRECKYHVVFIPKGRRKAVRRHEKLTPWRHEELPLSPGKEER
ncbi:hypothetical protein SIID45300_02664 [Candidatus Magnetaquicoccaceae bacterium FCR-1]|uniref:Transposase n=1 Tax=Candidatus Magnetaquiglobus chichijimensis TaxID=3141448 RepID=A0ABQ0CBQ7_9PROT